MIVLYGIYNITAKLERKIDLWNPSCARPIQVVRRADHLRNIFCKVKSLKFKKNDDPLYSRVDGILLYFKEENILFTGRHCSPIYALIFLESSTCTDGLNKYLKMEFFFASSFCMLILLFFYYKRYLRSLITKIFDSLS